jgi:hypothetical protein
MRLASSLALLIDHLAPFAKPFLVTFCIATAALRLFRNVRVIGVTGSIASGKSSFCRLLRSHVAGLRVVDADELARGVTAAGQRRQQFQKQNILPIVC